MKETLTTFTCDNCGAKVQSEVGTFPFDKNWFKLDGIVLQIPVNNVIEHSNLDFCKLSCAFERITRDIDNIIPSESKNRVQKRHPIRIESSQPSPSIQTEVHRKFLQEQKDKELKERILKEREQQRIDEGFVVKKKINESEFKTFEDFGMTPTERRRR